MEYYTSGGAAKHLNISVRTLRYYDQIKLVVPNKNESGKRLYTNKELIQLEKILLLKSSAMSLADIKKVLNKITIEEVLTLHKLKLDDTISQLEKSRQQTQALCHVLKLEGDLNWDQLLPLVRENTEKNHWEDYFSKEEITKLKSRLPKMEDPSSQEWIDLINQIKSCLKRRVEPQSEEASIIAQKCLLLSKDLFKKDPELADKFWEARKSPQASTELGLYPLSPEILQFLEEALQHLDGESFSSMG
ncbi:MerR family transcriptional regulator [Halobacillus massiliensis]|uniref:MerR family transcriptional regulator n=1 Tax=Halobacillus massiliensis TaxID=1926286 RepID=UPI0015C41010|nr:MerR family transcriptional regulator [Halobacillus massiliensis]